MHNAKFCAEDIFKCCNYFISFYEREGESERERFLLLMNERAAHQKKNDVGTFERANLVWYKATSVRPQVKIILTIAEMIDRINHYIRGRESSLLEVHKYGTISRDQK